MLFPSDERSYQPDFDADERAAAKTPRYSVARECARRLIKQYKIVGPPVRLDTLIEARGLTLARVEADAKLSGQLYPSVPEIVVNTRGRSVERQRFTAAHELGHWELKHHLLGDLPPDTLGYSGVYEGDGSSEGHSAIEAEANAFAAELLMPAAWVKKLGKPLQLNAPQRLAKQYEVSEQAMFYQLMHCHMF